MSELEFQSAIPLLDLERFDVGSTERERFLCDLRHAAREVGFFYVSGHGVAPKLLSDLLSMTRRFFALPLHDKCALDIANSPHFRGYTRVAWERTRGREDWREQLDLGGEESPLSIEGTAPVWTRLHGPNQWPARLPELRSIALEWQAGAGAVLVRLLHMFALALGQDGNALEPLYRNAPYIRTKLLRYPGQQSTDGDQGVGAHKDAGLLSLLLQDDEPGLEVRTDQGWINVPPRPGALVVNIGELLELASDGYLRATLHRVVTPPANRERLSAAFFLSARLDAVVPILRLPDEFAAQARGPERDPNNPLLRDVGWNALKVRLRSHPDVARRHYADVLAADIANPTVRGAPGEYNVGGER
jgi:isopenicillin N synthase-like dioxygenase